MAKPKLTREDCADIRRMYADRTRQVSTGSIAHLFRVSHAVINNVLNNKYTPLEDYEERKSTRKRISETGRNLKMDVEVRTSDHGSFDQGKISRIGACLQIELPTFPNVPNITVRLTLDQWKVLEESARHAQDGM